uniref:Uncharacterized protein n=1 Tax=Euplotes harpa TaxID=151035 RepID=A0A7S3N885_9SPIT|mmetsp:Transcript_22722/g.26084  ORF Transcript_22722/g.26084 Transcript_22722/m.26084 type:complete len:161 (+) Transcript_22722:451-933(+)
MQNTHDLSTFEKQAEVPADFDFDSLNCNARLGRWGKKEDSVLYKILLKLQEMKALTISQFLDMQAPITSQAKKLLNVIAYQAKWSGPIPLLLKRIKKIIVPSKFTAREVIQLKRILRKEYGFLNIDYQAVAIEFPGKDVEYVQKECDKIVAERLSQLNKN